MKRSCMLMVVVALAVGIWRPGISMGQQVAAPSVQTVRVPQPVRSYRSYSVSPSNMPRGEVRRNGPHSSDATWRHAGAKPAGHYGSGR